MRKRPFPITETPPRCLNRCHFCFHYHESGMSGENGMGYCLKWTWQHNQWVVVKRNEVCPQFFRSIPLVALVWGGIELELLNHYKRTEFAPWSKVRREVLVETNAAGEPLPDDEKVWKCNFQFAEAVYRQCYEATVEVIIRRTEAGHEIIEAIPTNPNQQNGAINREKQPEWVEAALDGIDEALKIVTARTGAFYEIQLVEITAKENQADVDVIKCAAALAVFTGIFPNDKSVSAVFEDFEWRLCENPGDDGRKYVCHASVMRLNNPKNV